MRIHDLIILGAGPSGIESALYASRAGLDFLVIEKQSPCTTLQRWGFINMFSPVRMNVSPLGQQVVNDLNGDDILTGREFKHRYFDRLIESEKLADRILSPMRAVSLGRQGLLKNDLVGDKKRADHPFRVMAVDSHGNEQLFFSRALIDATGVYDQPRNLGQGGMPAVGERALHDQIGYHVEDLERPFEDAKTFVVVGAGHSACTAVSLLESNLQNNSEVRLVWIAPNDKALPVQNVEQDPLPERSRIVKRANDIVAKYPDRVELKPGWWVERVANGSNGSRFELSLTDSQGDGAQVEADRIFAMVGFRPDRSLYEELQVHECYASAGPMKLSAALLSSSASTDCLAPLDSADDLYNNPEPNFFIIGAKSYGRSTNFLLQKGHDEIRTIFKQITHDPNLDLYNVD